MKLLDVGGQSFAVVEQLAAVVALDPFVRREVVHPLDVTPVGAHVTKHLVTTETLYALGSFL